MSHSSRDTKIRTSGKSSRPSDPNKSTFKRTARPEDARRNFNARSEHQFSRSGIEYRPNAPSRNTKSIGIDARLSKATQRDTLNDSIKSDDDDESAPTTSNPAIKAVWRDSDDEEPVAVKSEQAGDQNKDDPVDLYSKNRLKKLRGQHGERHISRTELTKRLRDFYVETVDQPSWAKVDDSVATEALSRAAQLATEADDLLVKLDHEHSSVKPETASSSSTVLFDDETVADAHVTSALHGLDRLDQLLSSSRAVGNKKLGFGNRGTGTLLSQSLTSKSLDVRRLNDVNITQPAKGNVNRIQFHPNNEIVVTLNQDRHVRLFQIDGQTNPMLQSFKLKDLEPKNATFLRDNTELLISGSQPFLYTYNLATSQLQQIPRIMGKQQRDWSHFKPNHAHSILAFYHPASPTIVLVDANSKLPIAELSGQSDVGDVAWSADDSQLYVTTANGQISIFDIGSRSIVSTFQDYGSIRGTTIATSTNGTYFAAGSSSGVVNMYDTDFSSLQIADSNVQTSFMDYYASYSSTSVPAKAPLVELTNLTTSISLSVFSPSNEIFAFGSREKKDQLRLIHLPSMKTYTTWPTQNTPLGIINDLAFSYDNSRMAVANHKGHVLLYRIGHYAANNNIKSAK